MSRKQQTIKSINRRVQCNNYPLTDNAA